MCVCQICRWKMEQNALISLQTEKLAELIGDPITRLGLLLDSRQMCVIRMKAIPATLVSIVHDAAEIICVCVSMTKHIFHSHRRRPCCRVHEWMNANVYGHDYNNEIADDSFHSQWKIHFEKKITSHIIRIFSVNGFGHHGVSGKRMATSKWQMEKRHYRQGVPQQTRMCSLFECSVKMLSTSHTCHSQNQRNENEEYK